MHHSRRGKGFWISIWHLLGHLAGTAFIFSVLMLISWSVGYFADLLHSHHEFPPSIYSAVLKIKLVVFWFDVAISSVVLIFGGWRFITDLWEY
jgi:hypothetical protein